MATVIVVFNLKHGVDPDTYERWARDRDVPTVKSLPAARDFRVQKVSGLLGSDAAAPYQYVEIIDIDDMDAFLEGIGGDAMQQVAAEFADFADNPTFLLTDQSA